MVGAWLVAYSHLDLEAFSSYFARPLPLHMKIDMPYYSIPVLRWRTLPIGLYCNDVRRMVNVSSVL